MDSQIKDSGKRQEYASGMVRDIQDDKPDYTLIDRAFLKRLANHMVKGAKKYGRNNWQLADSLEELDRFKASAMRHLMQWLDGDIDEDHMAAVAFNLAAAEYVKERLAKRGLLSKRDDHLSDMADGEQDRLGANSRNPK